MQIPVKYLRNGDPIPGIGLGTFGSDRYDPPTVSDAVRKAIDMGYRLIDCASVYGNEHLIGDILSEVCRDPANPVSRSDLFVISKVWNDSHGHRDVYLSCMQSLKDLQLEYLDLYIVHWPFPNFHPKGAPPDYHHPDARPYIHERFMETWRQMERLQQAGFVRHIGTSNMTLPKLEKLVQDCVIMPSANEMELHPTFQQPELFDYCRKLNILPVGYSPLGSPSRPERDKTPDDLVDMEQAAVVSIANKHGLHPAQVCLKWAVQRGQVPIPFSVKEKQLLSNLAAVSGEPLSDEEMNSLKAVNCDNRLIKGQVFLWDGAKDWRDLWDLNGQITS